VAARSHDDFLRTIGNVDESRTEEVMCTVQRAGSSLRSGWSTAQVQGSRRLITGVLVAGAVLSRPCRSDGADDDATTDIDGNTRSAPSASTAAVGAGSRALHVARPRSSFILAVDGGRGASDRR